MKNLIKLSVSGVALVLWAGTSVLSFRADTQTASAAADSPRSLYVRNCASCHGNDGKAQTDKGRQLDADDITGGVSESKTIRIVTNGRDDMPSFRKKLSAAQIKAIAGYVSSLK